MRRFEGWSRAPLVLALLTTLAAPTAPAAAAAATALPALGDPAPPLPLDAAVSGGTGRHGLEGKTVVLEFFATWCAPCRATMPHLNELHAAFAGPDVAFVAVSNETCDRVEAFLARQPIEGLVLAEPEGTALRAYAVNGIPQTFLIDRNGILRWRGYPDQLTPTRLRAFVETGELPGASGRP